MIIARPVLLLLVAIFAQFGITSEGRAEQHSPLLGSWSLDVAQMQAPADMRPKSVTITFAKAGESKWSTQVAILAQDNSVREMTGVYSLGGIAASIVGDQMEADTAAVTIPLPNVMLLALAKAGRPASTRLYTVSSDGSTMTEKAVSWDDKGTPVIRTNIFRRNSP
jgi:hypothetical protein